MKKITIFVACVLVFTQSIFANENEISKIENIVTYLNVKVTYNEQMNPIDYFFVFYANNGYYSSDLFVIDHGDAQRMYDTLSDIIAFGEKFNEHGISKETERYNLTLFNIMGTKYIAISVGENSDSIRFGDLKLVRKKLVKYCKKNNINIQTN